MKSIVDFDKEIGTDGLHAKGGLAIEGANLKAYVEAVFPLAKVVDPAMKVVDTALDKLEAAIPGDWDKAIIEKIKLEAREQLVKILAE